MSDPFIGEIRIFAGAYAPYGWALCNGTLIQIRQNQALYAVIGNTYGGDGKTTFALPNLMGRAVMHSGNGPGLQPRILGENGGGSNVALTSLQIPSHSHNLQVNTTAANNADPADKILATPPGRTPPKIYASESSQRTSMHPNTISATGGGQPHNNMQPYIAVNFIIAVTGIFPPRS